MSEEKVLTPNPEPLFKLDIDKCYFDNLTMVQLQDKLNYMRKLNLTRHFHITEQGGKWVPKPKDQPRKEETKTG